MSGMIRAIPESGTAAPVIEPPGSDQCRAVLAWLHEAQRPNLLDLRRVPLHALADWRFDGATGHLRHRSGRFFSIEGCAVTADAGPVHAWMQPIINQPEVGLLGFLVAYVDGELHVLAQRKIEAGNVNIAQISPTLQATRSNYTRVHGGAAPPYLEFFFDPPSDQVLVDELQLEQASRYLGKRNRNLIVEVDRGAVPLGADYRWISLRVLTALACEPNALNLDSRSVLSCLPVRCVGPAQSAPADAPFPARVRASLAAPCPGGRASAIRAWLSTLEQRSVMRVRPRPLRDLAGWRYDGDVIAHESGRFFEILGVSVLHAPTREVTHWDQPLVRSRGRGIIGFLCQQRSGILQCLVRGVLEPGAPRVRIAPTLQCIPENHDTTPPFFEDIARPPEHAIRFRAVQSEEGGRFYHDERLLTVVELPADTSVEAPPEYRWLTLGDIKAMIHLGQVNIEARSLIACLPIGG